MEPLGSSMPAKVLTDVGLNSDDVIQLSLSLPHDNTTLSGSQALTRELHRLEVKDNWITTYLNNSANTQKYPLNSNVELAVKEIQSFMKTVSKAESHIRWESYDLSDDIIESILRIEFGKLDVNSCRITASNESFKKLLTLNVDKVHVDAYTPPSLLNDELLPLFKFDVVLSSCSLNDAPDNLLESPKCKEWGLDLSNYFNAKLSFAAIQKYFRAVPHANSCLTTHYLGIIGYQQMPDILQFYHKKTWVAWNSTWCNINNSSFLEFKNIFAENKFPTGCCGGEIDFPTFSISLERSSTGPADNVTVPEELVDLKTLKSFKALVQVVQSDIPMKSIVPADFKLEKLRIYREVRLGNQAFIIHATIPSKCENQKIEIRIERTKVDIRLAREIVVKILKLCSSIEHFEFFQARSPGVLASDYNDTGTIDDIFFTLLCENAIGTKITNEWTMKLQLSEHSLACFRENRLSPLFKSMTVEEDKVSAKKKNKVVNENMMNGPEVSRYLIPSPSTWSIRRVNTQIQMSTFATLLESSTFVQNCNV